MMTLASRSIGRRLALLLAVLVGFTVTVAAAGAWGERALWQLTHQGIEVDVRLAQQAAEIRTLVLLGRRYEKDSFINAADASARDDYARRWETTRRQLQDAIGAAGALASADEDREALATMARSLETYAAGFAATLAELREGRLAGAAEANRHLGRVKDAVRGMEAAAEGLNQRALTRTAQVLPGLDALGDRLALLQGGLTLAVVLLALLFGTLIARSITRPIAEAVRVADAVADGRLDVVVPAGGADETGRLLQSLEHMRQGLVRLVGAMRDASSSIATGSAQIAQGNADLSQRTEEQAANLQQTAASMEEINATADNNLEITARAAALAADAERAALEGGSVTGRVVATMDRISESSRRITEIVGTIDGIAFQTNILALNAAVEAARAGEQGRGFAVVAGEVRALAQRAGTAAGDIRRLIEGSAQGVADGSREVGEAGRAMGALVEQVRQVAQLVGTLSSSQAEQRRGIGQIGDAMNQLDEVTQRNAALVEESAAAAASLRAQSERMAGTVARFRLAA